MGILSEIYNLLLYQPLFNGLIAIYNFLPFKDFGLAIIILTSLVRIILFPLTHKALIAQKQMSELQPKIKEAQEKYAQDKETQARVLMQLYKENKVNPFSGCLPILIQFPVLIALYQVFINGFKPETLKLLYGFVVVPQSINPFLLGLVDLSKKSPILAIAAGLFQLIQSKMSEPKIKAAKQDSMLNMTRQMTFLLPIMTVFITWSFPSGLALYWIVTTIWSILQQVYIDKGARAKKIEARI